MFRIAIFLWLQIMGLAYGHMQLTFPLPLESSLDTRNTNPDYSMTAPLNQDGSNFPCKGYLSRPDAHVTATFTAGQTANFTLAGSATHGGGSCQVSLSYDGGITFKVINSILGGCPLQNTYDFAFPANLPAGNNVVFSWSWMNKVGNREFYQNCALIDVVGSGSQAMLATLPDMQVANVGKGCTSVEGTEVIPLNPGTSVQYGGSYAAGASAVNGLFGAGLTGSCGTASSASLSTSKIIAATSSTTIKPMTTSSSTLNNQPVSTSTIAASATTTTQSGSCSNGAIVCTGTGYTWSLCSGSTPVPMGAVAPGTICKLGAIVLDTASSTSTKPAGNVAQASSTTQSTTSSRTTLLSTTTSVALQVAGRPVFNAPAGKSSTTTATLPAATSNCLSKRELRTCEDFSLKCGAEPQSYHICSRGSWSDPRLLTDYTSCQADRIVNMASEPDTKSTQRFLKAEPKCIGTGISCSEDGLTYYLCDTEQPLSVPDGMKCLEIALGGAFVSWGSR